MTHQMVGSDGLRAACGGSEVTPGPDCPVEVTVAVLRGRWTPLVLLQFLRNEELGFSELAAPLSERD